MGDTFDPTNVDLTSADPNQVVCYLSLSGNAYDGSLGARVSSLFVILIMSTICTFFPVVAKTYPKLKIPEFVYLFARYFGTGVILATAFIHLQDPAYASIGPGTCIGTYGNWSNYSWCTCIIFVSSVFVFLMDLAAEVYVEWKYGVNRNDTAEDVFVARAEGTGAEANVEESKIETRKDDSRTEIDSIESVERGFRTQIAAFLILEFGVLFHSVMIGLTLAAAGSEFATLYPVIVFHQSFEGLGIGARMSAIPFGPKRQWLQWVLCSAYGLTTPIAIAIGLGLRTTYASNSFTANMVSGILNAISAGILIYTAFVELLARDFLFDPKRTKSHARILFMVVVTMLGAGIMALLGKWA
jgi:zinc transporter 1/2/3